MSVRPAPGSVPRNGLPLGKPYIYRGTGTAMSPAEITAHLRPEIAGQQHAPLPAVTDADPVTNREALAAMCISCLVDACHTCYGDSCKCACQDEPPGLREHTRPEPQSGRCGKCGYRTTSLNHKTLCRGTP